MFKIIEFLRSKPSDKNIRIIRVLFALVLIAILYFGIPFTSWNFEALPPVLLYALYCIPLIGLIRGIFDPGIMRRKLWKWTIISIGVLMMMTSLFLIESTPPSIVTPETPTEGVSALDLATTVETPRYIDADFWIGFLGFWLALVGITLTSKNITTKNERYGEKVKKIRV